MKEILPGSFPEPLNLFVSLSRREYRRLVGELALESHDNVLRGFATFLTDCDDEICLELMAIPASQKLKPTERHANIIEVLAFLENNPFFVSQHGTLECRDMHLKAWGHEAGVSKCIAWFDSKDDGTIVMSRKDEKPECQYRIIVASIIPSRPIGN